MFMIRVKSGFLTYLMAFLTDSSSGVQQAGSSTCSFQPSVLRVHLVVSLNRGTLI